MSAIGKKLTCALVRLMSAMCHKQIFGTVGSAAVRTSEKALVSVGFSPVASESLLRAAGCRS